MSHLWWFLSLCVSKLSVSFSSRSYLEVGRACECREGGRALLHDCSPPVDIVLYLTGLTLGWALPIRLVEATENCWVMYRPVRCAHQYEDGFYKFVSFVRF